MCSIVDVQAKGNVMSKETWAILVILAGILCALADIASAGQRTIFDKYDICIRTDTGYHQLCLRKCELMNDLACFDECYRIHERNQLCCQDSDCIPEPYLTNLEGDDKMNQCYGMVNQRYPDDDRQSWYARERDRNRCMNDWLIREGKLQ